MEWSLFLNKMKFNIYNISGKQTGNVTLKDNVFNIEPNNPVIRQAVLAELTNMRQGTHSSKNRANVRGGGKKPWKQKGRGAARAGTNRSPIWRGGGVIFGPTPHSYSHKVSKKVSRLSRKSLLSIKFSEKCVTILDNLNIGSHKTSTLVSVLDNFKLRNKKIVVITKKLNNDFDLASRNLQNIVIVSSYAVSSYDLIDCEHLIIDKDSIADLTNILSK